MNDVCSVELLTNAVANRLTADEEAALYDHLEQCEACCARMEQLAGGEQWQKEAASLLTTDELDAAVPEPMVWSEVDFSVEHLEPSEDANVLGQLGGYDVLAIIGRGGMGVVLKAFDRELKRFVAIKALSPHLAHSSVARKRFAREAQAAAAVVNPHVIAIHHVQPTGRLPFLIMPLLTGESLAQRLKSRAPLELTEVLRIGMQAAVGLAAAHDQGLVHRDVKPANIFLEKGVERVVITDFGLARAADDVSMTRQGVVAGTPEYMSPEQARGEALDARSDLFSLGCVLYEMATGVSPFRSDSTIATLRRIVDDKPAAIASLAPELPPWFSYIVGRLLSKDPAQRFASASEVSQLLEQCLSHLQQPASVPLPASLMSHTAGHRLILPAIRKGVTAMFGSNAKKLLILAILYMTLSCAAFAYGLVRVFDGVELNLVYGFSFFVAGISATFASTAFWIIEAVNKRSRAVSSIVPNAAELSSINNSNRIGAIAMLGTFAAGLLGMVLMQATEPPDISGQWFSDAWGAVVLDDKGLGKYEGTFSGVGGDRPAEDDPTRLFDSNAILRPAPNKAIRKGESGTIQLKWSRVERRFNGTWGEGDGREGKISLRLVDDEIRGAWTTNKVAQKDSGGPRLGDLTWTRVIEPIDAAAPTLSPDRHDHGTDIHGSSEDHQYLVWEEDGRVRLSHWFAKAIHVDDEPLRLIDQLLSETWAKYIELESQHTTYSQNSGRFIADVSEFNDARQQLESDFWTRLDEIVSGEQRALLHAISTARGDANGDDTWPYRPKAFPSIIGWHETRFPVRLEVWTKGTWFHWRVTAGSYSVSGDGQKLPAELQHYWTLGNRKLDGQFRRTPEHASDVVINATEVPAEKILWNVAGAVFVPVLKEELSASQWKGGLRVTHLREHGPAEDAMLRVGDIIVEIDSRPIESIESISLAWRRSDFGAPVSVRLLRGGQPLVTRFKWDVHALRNDAIAKGTVLSRSEHTIVVSLGTDDGVYPGDRLEAGTPYELCRLEVVTVSADQSVARIVSEHKGMLVKVGDSVIYGPAKLFDPPSTRDEQTKVPDTLSQCVETNVDNDQARQLRTEAATQSTGRQLGTVLGKPIHEGDINKNTSTHDNLIRLALQPLTEDYCRKNGLGRAEELNAKIKDEGQRKAVSMFVSWWELQRHLYEKHSGRVEVSAFGNVAFDGMRKWLDEREQAGDFEITDPQLKTVLKELYNHVPPGTMFAKPDQLEAVFDKANIDRFIEEYAKIPAGAYRNPAKKLVGTVFDQPLHLHERYLANKAELPGLLYNLFVPELEERYRKQHPEVEPTKAEIDDLAAKTKAGLIQSAIEQRKALEAALERQKLTDPTSTKEVPGTQAFIEQVDETLKRLEVNDGRSQAAESLRRRKLQKHIYENYGGGRALMGGSQGLVLVDAQRQWLDEREQLGEFQIASNEFRMILESYWTIESHPGSKLIEGTDLRKIFDFNLPGKSPSIQHQSNLEARTLNGEKATIYNEQARQLRDEEKTISISDFKQLSEAQQVAWLKDAVLRFREEAGNISATAVMSTQNFEYEPTSQQKSNVLLMTGHTHDYQIRRIHNSYRVRHTQEPPDRRKNYTTSISHFDDVAGRLRQHDDVRGDSGDHKSQGIIRPERDEITRDCFFYQYLGDDSHGEPDAIPKLWDPAGRYLQHMDHARVVEIQDSESAVKIAFPCKMPWGVAAESELLFDLAKGGLLIDMTVTELAAKEGDVKAASHRYRMTMTQPVLVEEVWLPTKFEMTAWSQNYPKQITLFEGKVSDIQLNKLTPADLEVVFPPGTAVSDAFSGEQYVVP